MQKRFQVLTQYIEKIASAKSFGEWVIDQEANGTPEHPTQMPYIAYGSLVESFVKDYYQFTEHHPELCSGNFMEVLENHGLGSGFGTSLADASSLNEQCVLALIMSTIRAERFCDGALLARFSDGNMEAWLKRLKDIDTI